MLPATWGIIPAYAGSTGGRYITVTGQRDHPRLRGEHRAGAAARSRASGSSPPTRGARHARVLQALPARIIPAYAGSTAVMGAPPSPGPDHPRLRGEHPGVRPVTTSLPGSSPPTRGAPMSRHTGGPRTRIIPAYAGSTLESSWRPGPSQDHPRLRGEHLQELVAATCPTGSSPPTRGAPGEARPADPHRRIIPAYAGSTTWRGSGSGSSSDHPRLRGEHVRSTPVASAIRGSSPPTRGAPRRDPHREACRGIIPAYAGSTARTGGPCRPHRDHPRLRGEHMLSTLMGENMPGSSPPTRGAPYRFERGRGLLGIIPAYAGSTAQDSRTASRIGDHPRLRGEHSCVHFFVDDYQGSSPPTRGARVRGRRGKGRTRIIPAYAGSTVDDQQIYPDRPRPYISQCLE